MRRTPLLVLGALIVGGALGAGVVYVLDNEVTTDRPRLLCETDASAIATAFQEQGPDLNLQIDC